MRENPLYSRYVSRFVRSDLFKTVINNSTRIDKMERNTDRNANLNYKRLGSNYYVYGSVYKNGMNYGQK
jgi:hypothetical protein